MSTSSSNHTEKENPKQRKKKGEKNNYLGMFRIILNILCFVKLWKGFLLIVILCIILFFVFDQGIHLVITTKEIGRIIFKKNSFIMYKWCYIGIYLLWRQSFKIIKNVTLIFYIDMNSI